MNAPFPADTPLTPEAYAQRAEWLAAPSDSAARQHASQALCALAEVSDSGKAGGDEVIPPLPDALRARWEEAYGEAVAAPVPRPRRREGVAVMLGQWWSERRALLVTCGGGLAVAGLAVMLAYPSGAPHTESMAAAVTTRGNAAADLARSSVHTVYLISTADPASVVAKLKEAFPARTFTVVTTREAVPADARFVIPLTADMQATPDSAVEAVETLDETEAAAPRP